MKGRRIIRPLACQGKSSQPLCDVELSQAFSFWDLIGKVTHVSDCLALFQVDDDMCGGTKTSGDSTLI